MKSMVLTGINSMELSERPLPEIIRPDDVLIRMTHVGVCGSDIHYYRTGRIGSQVVKFPFAVGHEGVGVVERIGNAVKHVKPGDAIAIEPAVWCGKCDQCLHGRKNTCRNLLFLGCPGQMEGCLSEYIVMPESSCFRIPTNVSPEKAALAEPLSIGIYAAECASVQKDAVVAILGSGPIGLSVLFALKNHGINRIYMTDLINERVAYAKKAGALWTGNPEKTNVEKEILDSEPFQMDIVFECCGKQEALLQGIHLLKPGGKLMIVGIPEFDNWTLPADIIRRKELTLVNIRRQNECLDKALEMIANDLSGFDRMITHRFAFDETQKAFDLVANYKDGVIKAIISIT